jgi:hypothetical protein
MYSSLGPDDRIQELGSSLLSCFRVCLLGWQSEWYLGVRQPELVYRKLINVVRNCEAWAWIS